MISFRIDWLDLLAVQGTLKSLLQHHSSKESILQCSALIMVQLSHPYMTSGKTVALTRWTFVSKVMSLLFNMLGFPYGSTGKESACNVGDLGFDPWVGKIPWRRERLPTPVFLGFPCGSAGKESACNVGDLRWEDPLEKGKATRSSILANPIKGLK